MVVVNGRFAASASRHSFWCSFHIDNRLTVAVHNQNLISRLKPDSCNKACCNRCACVKAMTAGCIGLTWYTLESCVRLSDRLVLVLWLSRDILYVLVTTLWPSGTYHCTSVIAWIECSKLAHQTRHPKQVINIHFKNSCLAFQFCFHLMI